MKQIFILLFFLPALFSCVDLGNAQVTENSEARSIPAAKTLKEIVETRKIPKKDLNIVIRKSARTLSVYFGDEELVSYPCVLGFAPEGDKMEEGDGKTPEGKFRIKSMYPHKSWSYFIWFDYPNAVSKTRFKARKADGTLSASARIGGEVGIHGVPAGNNELIEKSVDWTLGCISLTTENITDLYQSIGTETSIEILK